jgi:periplasmic protein TonB
MFSDLSVAHGVPVRRWTPLVSFSVQTMLIAAALIYLLLRLEPLPPLSHPVSLPVFGGFAPIRPQTTVVHGGSPGIAAPIVVGHGGISFRPAANPWQGANPSEAPSIDFGPGPVGPSLPIAGSYVPPMPTVSRPVQNVRTSVMMEGNLIRKVEPLYPSMAKQLHVQGAVIIKAWISRDGLIEREQIESGHPLLVRAALDAVRQWRYRPYYLNHEPVEVETEITVNFVLQR